MIIVGLGNPGEEYENTRHNAGRSVVIALAKKIDAEFAFDKKSNALIAKGKVGKKLVTCILPETFMNKSGSAVGYFVKSAKAAGDMIVVHDDLDIPFGKAKMSFNKSSGGHKGVESVIKAVKTESFWRIRIGITKATASGKLKKPDHDTISGNFIVAKWKPTEADEFKKFSKKIVACLELAVSDSPAQAMNMYNAELNS